LRKGDQRVLDVLERLQDDALYAANSSCCVAVWSAMLPRIRPPEKICQEKLGADGEEHGSASRRSRSADALRLGRPADEEARKEVTGGDADLGRLRRELPFRAGDVGPAEQELGRRPTATCAGGFGIGPTAASSSLERHRRLPDQDAQRVHRLRGLLHEERDRRGGGGHLGGGALDVQLRREPRI
jgi:hypothetical protein